MMITINKMSQENLPKNNLETIMQNFKYTKDRRVSS